MSGTMTHAEMLQDLANTQKDVARLELIVENLSLFIRDSAGEDRSNFKICLMKCEVALERGRKLVSKISGAIAERIQENVTKGVKP